MKAKILALGLVFVCLAGFISAQLSRSDVVGYTNTKSMALRIGVWDWTEDNPIHIRAEIWIRGVGSKYLKRAPFVVGKFPVDVKQECFFYPESREGKEIMFTFMMTEDMNPNGSVRDTLWISFYDEEVEVSGLPITAATGKSELKFKRKRREN